MKKKILELEEDYIAYILAVFGLLLVIFPGRFTDAAPSLVGAGLLIMGVFGLAAIFFFGADHSEAGRILLYLAVGAALVRGRSSAVELMGFVWAILALYEAGEEINGFIENKKVPIVSGVVTLVSVVLAVMLLFEPFHHFSFHVRILGIEMILSVFVRHGVRMMRDRKDKKKEEENL